jgi:transcriptional regulator with XRE-family HTH domain
LAKLRRGSERIGENLRRLAGMHLVSLVDLANYVGLSRQAVQSIASGKSQPSAANLKRLAEAFGVSADALFGEPQACLAEALRDFNQAPIARARYQEGEALKALSKLPQPFTKSEIIERLGVSQEQASRILAAISDPTRTPRKTGE